MNFVNAHRFETLLVLVSKSGQADQMTMPARRASKFSAKRRAVSPEMFFQSLISQAIPGFCEPWSECQPEESRPPEGWPEDSRKPQPEKKHDFLDSLIVPISGFLDMRKLFPGTFQDFMFDMLKSLHF